MSLVRTLFRLASVSLLLLIGADLVACELVSPDRCELAGAPCHESAGCLCCCPHVVVATPFVFERSEEAVVLEARTAIFDTAFEIASIYHPPKP